MHKNTLPRRIFEGGWAHPYGHGPFSPFLYSDGGDGGGSGSGAGNDGGGNPPAMPPAPAAPPADPWASFQWDGKVESLPEPVAKVIREARAEAGKERTTAKENAAKEAREALLRELSGGSEEPLTPEQLAQQLKEARDGATSATEQAIADRIELQVYRTAVRLGANADKLLDSRAFCDEIDGLDPSDPKDFAAKVEATIKAALKKDESLRAGQAPRRGGGDFPGGPGTTGRPTSLGQAVAAALGGG